MRATCFAFALSVLVSLLSVPSVASATLPRNVSPAPEAHVAGEHETEYAIDAAHAGRAHNVELAASRLDGVVIEPGATFSFDAQVGERSVANGFAVAPELHGGHVHEGIGGGVCQVATTLHVAALEAGLEIVEHRAHSIPSRYAPAGLDATVFYGRVDYRVRNPYAFPIVIRTASRDGVLAVSLEASEPVARATVETRTVRTLPRTVQTIVDPTLASGIRVVDEPGRAGLVVQVTTTREDGTRASHVVRYGMEPRVVRVGA